MIDLLIYLSQVREIELAVDEKELQKEAALKEKEKEIQQLRTLNEDLNKIMEGNNGMSVLLESI